MRKELCMNVLEELIVLHCSPTLASLKPASLFSYPCVKTDDVYAQIERTNDRLNKKGIYITIVAQHNSGCLLMVYHSKLLFDHLSQYPIYSFLVDCDYQYKTLREAIMILKERLKEEEFPHEIGVFLGYPLVDVISFIQNEGRNYREIGYWKVYHNLQEAQSVFRCFQHCVESFQAKFYNGTKIENLVNNKGKELSWKRY